MSKNGIITANSKELSDRREANKEISISRKNLQISHSILNIVKSLIPEKELIANFTKKDIDDIKKGVLEILRDKDDNCLAILRDTQTKEIRKLIRLKEKKIRPEVSDAINNYLLQRQLLDIKEQLIKIQQSINTVLIGQKDDRIALCNSSEQLLKTGLLIKNKDKRNACLQSALKSAEDGRNQIINSITRHLEYFLELPTNPLRIFLDTNNNQDKISKRVADLKEEFIVLTRASFTAADILYQLGEPKAMHESINFYLEYLNKNFTNRVMSKIDSAIGNEEDKKFWNYVHQKIEKEMITSLQYIGTNNINIRNCEIFSK